MRRPVRLAHLSNHCAVLLCALALTPRAVALQSTPRSVDDAPQFVAQLEAWVPAALERIEIVPGLAIAVVVDDRVVIADAWGVADIDTGEPVDADTQFYIASMTKSFTALAAVMLHAREELDLNSALSEHLHGVELAPELRADEVLLYDFLTHTSGVSSGPIAFRLAYTGEHSPELLWKLLAASTPNESAPLGSYEYTNVGYNILGMIMDRETGKVWQDQLRDLIFEPLGMQRTTAYASLGPSKGWTVAAPHFGLNAHGVQRLPLQKDDATMQSAGGLMTTAHDMARWLSFQINDGMLDGEQLVPAKLMQATHEQAVSTGEVDRPPFSNSGYGLGWSHGTLSGQVVLSHGGGYPGFRSMMSFMPEARVGVAVFANEDSFGGALLDDVLQQCYAWWLGEASELDFTRVDDLAGRRDGLIARGTEMRAQMAEREWALSRPREAYVGRFVSDLVGTLEVRDLGEEFAISLGKLSCTPTPYPQAETMRVELIPQSGSVVQFLPVEGRVESILLDGDTFTREP